jgi:hypothetical protein
MTRPNEFRAYLTFTGEFDPDEITERLQLVPSNAWKKGDRNEKTHMERKFSRWSLESRLPQAEPIVSQIRDVLAQVGPASKRVRDLRSEYTGEMQVVAYFHSESPWFHFDEDVVAGCAEMKLSIDCDFYTLYSDRREDS